MDPGNIFMRTKVGLEGFMFSVQGLGFFEETPKSQPPG